MSAAAIAIPAIISALGAYFGRQQQQSLSPQQQALQEQTLQLQNNRMLLQNPLFEQVTQGAMSRMPRSSLPAQYQLANMQQNAPGFGGYRTPSAQGMQTGTVRRRGSLAPADGTAQALQQLAQYTRQPTSYR